MKVRHFSQPNLLAGKELVPEFFQEAANAGESRRRARAAGSSIPTKWRACSASSRAIHEQLRRDGAERAAAEIAALLTAGPRSRRGRAMKVRVRLRVAGVDEAGRGPLAGPVVAAAVILNPARPIRGLADSKVLEPEERERLALLIRERALCYSVAWADAEEIDSINILQATMLAMRRALLGLRVPPQQVFVDGNRCPVRGRTRFRMPVRGGGEGRCHGAVDQRRVDPRQDHARCADARSRRTLSGVLAVRSQGLSDALARGGAECAGPVAAAPAQLLAGARAQLQRLED